jgi:S1-C subfamily serine protease
MILLLVVSVVGCTQRAPVIKESVVLVRSFSDNTSQQSSGFIVSSDGLILTFLWDRPNVKQLEVVFSDGTVLPAYIQSEESSELPYWLIGEAGILPGLAYIKVEATNLTPLPSGIKNGELQLKVGDPVIMAGYSVNGYIEIEAEVLDMNFDLPMVSTGVTVLSTYGEPLMEGGPVVNGAGQVVGVIIGFRGTEEGYMIPLDYIQPY